MKRLERIRSSRKKACNEWDWKNFKSDFDDYY